MRHVLALLALTSPAFADPYALRVGDTPFAPDALTQRLSGQVLTFFDDGRSEYFPDGRYSYTYADGGGTAYGYWSVEADGRVCIAFVHGFGRCDLYVRNDGRLILLDERGERYPVRP